MTQKEKIFREWYSIKNEVSRLKGEKIMNVDLAVQRHNLSSFKVKELEQLVEIEKRHLEAVIKETEVKRFYETEEGAEYKTKYEKQKKDLIAKRKNYILDFRLCLENFIKEWLGEKWVVKIPDYFSCKIAVGENYESLTSANPFFELYYPCKYFKEEKFECKIYTCQHINPCDSKDNGVFFMGMAKLTNDVKNATHLKNILSEFTDNLCSIDGEIDEVEDKLGKPLEHLKNDD